MENRRRAFQNPYVRDIIYFVKFADEGKTNETIIDVEQTPGGDTGLHYHRTYDEYFDVKEGILSLQVGKEILKLKPGEKAVAPRNTAHRFFNTSDAEVKFQVTVRPGHTGFENTIKIAYGLADDGKTNKKGVPLKIWQLGVLMYLADMHLPGFFGWIQPLLYRMGKSAMNDGRFERELKKYTE